LQSIPSLIQHPTILGRKAEINNFNKSKSRQLGRKFLSKPRSLSVRRKFDELEKKSTGLNQEEMIILERKIYIYLERKLEETTHN